MDERVSTGEFLSMDPTTPAWRTEVIVVKGTSACKPEILALSSLTFLLALVGLAGNATVLWLLGFRMRRTPFSVYILNLAGADFLFLGFRLIDSLFYWVSYRMDINISRLFELVSYLFYLVGLSLLSAISTERCLSVLWPIWHRCHRPRHTSALVCALLWTLSLVIILLEGNECGSIKMFSLYVGCRTFDFITASWLIALCVILIGFTLALLLRVFCGSRRMPVTRLFVTLVLTVLVFLVFGLPLGIYWFLLWWIDIDFNICSPYLLTIFLSSVNSCANPIIYFFVGSFRHHRSQRKTLKLILQRAMQDTPEEGESGDRGPSGNSRELENLSSRC